MLQLDARRRAAPVQKSVWFFRALVTLIAVRIQLSLRRADVIRAGIVAHAAVTPPDTWEMRLTNWSVTQAARLVPRATCLTQAFAGQQMLARRGKQSMVRISIPAGHYETFAPHAWLMVENHIVLGGEPDEYVRHHTLLHYRSNSMTPLAANALGDHDPAEEIRA